MLKCWAENPSDRPTFAKLKDTLKEMERNHKVISTVTSLETKGRKLFCFLFDFFFFCIGLVTVNKSV